MKNTRDPYKNLSEKSSLYRYQTLKIPGNTEHYLEFYRLVLVVGQCLVHRGSRGKIKAFDFIFTDIVVCIAEQLCSKFQVH